ncbi:MAG TPA: 50S ribosomal protein L15 [Candidatus Saccharimonadales bacterium]|nr:50S ribosomal protein L15 [Candidatus Saccharimonadales bacterium]
MKPHELAASAHKSRKRVGRGISSGHGKTAGRGTKGQNSRSGGGVRLGFEGGQNPLAKRLPKKRGFTSINRIDYQEVNLNQLDSVKGTQITPDTLAQAKLVKSSTKPVKILGDGKIERKLSFKVQAMTIQAKAKVEAAGGTIELLSSTTKP